MANDRHNSVEAETSRLYFRHYVSDILTNPSPLPTCEIRPRGSATVLATLTVVQESTGVFYADWSIPSSQVDSLKYNPSFPGPGDYQDIWKSGATTLLAQDFFVAEEGFPDTLARITEPIRLTHTLETPRFEVGAKDYLTWRIAEQSGRLVPGESLYPEGEIQLFYGDQLIKNYEPFIHREDSDQYKWFLDTTPLKDGVYKVQGRFFVPQTIVNTPASVTTTKSLANGFSPSTDTVLGLTIDGQNRTITFPTSSTQATVQGQVVSFNFSNVANDVFIINVDGTEKTIRLVNTGAVKVIADVVDELNGNDIAPFDAPPTYHFSAGAITYPIVTSYLTLGGVPAGINGTTFLFKVDGIDYAVQFSSITSLNDIVNQVNTEYGFVSSALSAIMRNFGGVLTLGNTIDNLDEIEIVGGTALPLLGFVEGQKDTSDHDVGTATATNFGGAIRITGPTLAGTLEILSGEEGSVANPYLEFSAGGETNTGASAEAAIITGSGATFPIAVTIPSAGRAISTADLPSEFTFPNTLGGDTVEINVDGAGNRTLTFQDEVSPAAITSTFAFGQYNVTGKTLVIEDVTLATTHTLTFTTTDPLTLSTIISQFNASAGWVATQPTNIIADSWNGHLRIRSTVLGKTFRIKAASTADTALGLDATLLTNPESYFQNDQVVTDGTGGLEASNYIEPFTQAMIVAQFNDVTYWAPSLPAMTASITANRLYIVSNTTGTSSTVQVVSGTAVTPLNLTAWTFQGTSASNYQFQITSPGPTQTISFTSGTKSLTQIVNEINSQAVDVVASVGGPNSDQLKLTTTSTGAGVVLTISDVTSGIINNLFGSASPLSDTGVNAAFPVITGDVYTSTQFRAGQNGTLIIALDGGIDVSIDISGVTTIGQLVTDINTAMFPNSIASNPSGTVLQLQSPTFGENSVITVGGINDGSNANPVLSISVDGVQVTGTNGQPYTLQQIVGRINAAFGGQNVSEVATNFLTLQSVESGAGAEVIVTDATSSEIVDIWGLSKGTYVGDSQTQTSQTIVSPKLTLFIGD